MKAKADSNLGDLQETPEAPETPEAELPGSSTTVPPEEHRSQRRGWGKNWGILAKKGKHGD